MLILTLALTVGFASSVFAFMELTLPNLALEINRKNAMDLQQRNLSWTSFQLAQARFSRPKRKGSMGDTWET